MKILLLPVVLAFCCVHGRAEIYEGAPAILQKISAAENIQEQPKATPLEDLRVKMKTFQNESSLLSPSEAAKRWVEIYHEYAAIPPAASYSRRRSGEVLALVDLIKILPPSSTWSTISTELVAQNDKSLETAGLGFFMAVLNGDTAVRNSAVAQLFARIQSDDRLDDGSKSLYQSRLKEIAAAIDWQTGSGEIKVGAFEKQLIQQEGLTEKQREESGNSITMPDLIHLSGEKNATALILRVFRAVFSDLDIEGKQTAVLAAKLALQNIAIVKKPLWSLIQNTDDAILYEAFQKKFPFSKERRRGRNQADSVYLLSLIAKGHSAEAARFTKETAALKDSSLTISSSMIEALQTAGLGKQVVGFLGKILADEPALPLWENYIELSAKQGESASALQFLKGTLAKPDLSPKGRNEVESQLYLALLAADEVDEGLKILRSLIKSGPDSGNEPGNEGEKERKIITLAGRLVSLGKLLKKPELITEGLMEARNHYDKLPASNVRASQAGTMARLYSKNADGPEAEALLSKELIFLAKPDQENRRPDLGAELLTSLAGVYAAAERPADVIALLDQSNQWGVADLGALSNSNFDGKSLMLISARALIDTGKKDRAHQLIQRILQRNPGNDTAYQMLLEIGADHLEADLDQLASQDRFEERPLIWKAKIQLDSGRIEEAEKTIRAAIAIDPSDGEEGKGDRLRAYAVLGDILEKKGDAENAKMMRGAVEAIRLSEDADDWWAAGLLTAAVRKYEEALGHFADAYCIQSRLARSYTQLGQFAKAEEHYRRAYELMPASFGRVESHCFGCEQAFAGKQAQGIAETVFTSLAAKMPDNPRVFYLLGYLRSGQEKFSEAAESLRKAVTLDADYLNAWKLLATTARQIGMPRTERESIIFEILRLDPSGRHSSPALNEITNLPLLWDTILKAEKTFPIPDDAPLYELVASKNLLEKRKRENPNEGWRYLRRDYAENNLRDKFATNSIIQSTLQILELINRSR